MKTKITLSIIGLFFSLFVSKYGIAQTTPETVIIEAPQVTIKDANPFNEKETQEIIIRKKGGKNTKVTLEITGNKVLINGKPMAEFKEDGIIINNRKMIIRDGNKITMDFNGDNFADLDKLDGLNSISIDKFNYDFDDKLNDSINRSIDKYFMFDNTNGLIINEIPKPFLGVGTEKNKEGAKIISVEKASPAEKAGLKKDDIIYKVNDKKVDGMPALSEIITAIKVGNKATVYFLRDGKKQQVGATIGERKNRFYVNKRFTYKMPNGNIRSLRVPHPPKMQWPNYPDINGDFNFDSDKFFFNKPKLGLKIQDTEEGTGVKVLDVEVESTSEKAGIIINDIVVEIAGKKITNTDEAREELHNNADKNTYSIKVKRNEKEMNFIIKIPKKLKTTEL